MATQKQKSAAADAFFSTIANGGSLSEAYNAACVAVKKAGATKKK